CARRAGVCSVHVRAAPHRAALVRALRDAVRVAGTTVLRVFWTPGLIRACARRGRVRRPRAPDRRGLEGGRAQAAGALGGGGGGRGRPATAPGERPLRRAALG